MRPRRKEMVSELNRTDDWSEFMSRMRHQFEELLESKPTCLQDMVQELREREDSMTFLDIVRDSVSAVKDTDLQVLRRQMQLKATMLPFKGRGSSARRAKSSMTLCCSLPKQLRCLPHPI